ncbi:hypothetical protein [Vibrio mexicanus]|uniref:hypothetical protein n=1 Tax=Vibrio mexicanus TaxID=1004326 RepID=UPI00063C1FC4|nr:hypothetical protein [Vibrio mexicanus]
MQKTIYVSAILLIGLLSSAVNAKGNRYGGTISQFSIESIDYEQGKSGEVDALRYGLTYTRPIDENNNRWRWWFGANYLNESVKAPDNGVYQEVSNFEFRVVPQYALTNVSFITPYIGAGVSLGYSQYSRRWVVDDEGYKYGDQLDDIDQFEVSLVGSVGTVIKLGSNPNAHLQFIPQVSYLFPVYNDGIGGLELSVSLLF